MGIDVTSAPFDLYITAELAARPVKTADHLQEKRAIQELAARMLAEPELVLPRFVELAMQMSGGVAAGLSLYEMNPAPGVFRWRYLQGSLASFENATTPRQFSPCGITLDEDAPVLSRHPERYYTWISDANIVVPEVLLVPLRLGGLEPLGTLWIVAAQGGHFDAGHARTAMELASFVGIALRMLETEKQLHAALEEQQTLAREMAHRVQNLFSVAQGLVRLTARGSTTKDEMSATLIGRFGALASAHGLARRSFVFGQGSADVKGLNELLHAITRPHENVSPAKTRFHIQGPRIELGNNAMSAMALVVNELTTNAAKYGALSDDKGRVGVTWMEAPGGMLDIQWREDGGPEIDLPPHKAGFGSRLLCDATRQLGGEISHDWEQKGLRVRITLPMANLAH